MILDNDLEAEWIAELHIKQFLGFADAAPFLIGFSDLGADDIQLIQCVFRRELR